MPIASAGVPLGWLRECGLPSNYLQLDSAPCRALKRGIPVTGTLAHFQIWAGWPPPLLQHRELRQLDEEVGNHHCLSGKPVSTACWRTISDSIPLLARDIILANWASSKGRCSAVACTSTIFLLPVMTRFMSTSARASSS